MSDFRFQTTMAPPYVMASWYKIDSPGKDIKVYIEDDGISLTAQEAENPTPQNTFLRKIAADDPYANVAYIARPCQYIQAGSCSKADWDQGRYSDKVIKSMEQSLWAMMKKAKAERAVLIGYGGGAQIAGMIAVRNPGKIKTVVTIAGILDHRAWTQYHNAPALSKSLNLKDKKTQFSKIDQKHFAGGRDEVVPPALIQEFVVDDTTIIVIPKATHERGYDKIYDVIYRMN
ncbi:MAG: hypothetical protein LBU87_01320 [Lactobacillales bacterium]|nr:hypothetical protein [Lactobacillales bacterium]